MIARVNIRGERSVQGGRRLADTLMKAAGYHWFHASDPRVRAEMRRIRQERARERAQQQ